MKIHATDDIPFGNVADVEITERDNVPNVAFAPHPHGGTEALWFCFRVTCEGPAPDNLTLTLKHPDTALGVNRGEGILPVVKRTGGDWERLAGGTARDLPDGRWTVDWEIANPTSQLDVAFCYPYGPDEIATLLADTGDTYRQDTIGVSQHGRPISRLSNSPGDTNKHGLYIIARQHSSEVSGTWILDGMLREFAEAGDRAPLVWTVPLSNVDGAMEGDYGKDPFPYDLNRAWSIPAMRHEVLVMQSDIKRWQQRCIPTLGLDLHSPGANESNGVYAFVSDPAQFSVPFQQAKRWTDAFRDALGDFAWNEFYRIAHYPSRWHREDTFLGHFRRLGVAAASVETPYGMIGDTVLTREKYREIGGLMAGAIMDQLEAGA